jgi:hypothetical protein
MNKIITSQPRFSVRGINVCESLARHSPEQVARLIERMASWNMNTLLVHQYYGYKFHKDLIESLCRKHGIHIIYMLHTAFAFTPHIPAVFFALDMDGNPRTKIACNETKLCVSNPEGLGLFRYGARRYFNSDRAKPESTYLVMDADGYLFCQCPKCRNIKPVDQWAILLEIAVEEANKAQKNLTIEYLSYVWRYSIPEKIELFQHVHGVHFDTHQRFRWRAFNEAHPVNIFSEIEAKVDSRAEGLPINLYLYERLKEWRQKYTGKLYVFENLMLQGSISCPQPYTVNLLKDLDLYESLGVDGVIYEVFEPGIQSFEKQLDLISESLLKKPQIPELSALEKIVQHLLLDEQFNYNPALGYLSLNEADILAAVKADGYDERLIGYLIRLRTFLFDRSYENYCKVARYVLDHQKRFDWMMILFNLIRIVPKDQLPANLNETTIEFMTVHKLWDMQEKMQSPIEETYQIVQNLIKFKKM